MMLPVQIELEDDSVLFTFSSSYPTNRSTAKNFLRLIDVFDDKFDCPRSENVGHICVKDFLFDLELQLIFFLFYTAHVGYFNVVTAYATQFIAIKILNTGLCSNTHIRW